MLDTAHEACKAVLLVGGSPALDTQARNAIKETLRASGYAVQQEKMLFDDDHIAHDDSLCQAFSSYAAAILKCCCQKHLVDHCLTPP